MEDLLAEKKPDATAGSSSSFISTRRRDDRAALAMAASWPGHPRPAGRSPPGCRRLGLAFQIVDDILDATADTATLGKTAGKDAKAGKATFVRLHGLDAATGCGGAVGGGDRRIQEAPGSGVSSCNYREMSSRKR